jgi:hypothetical protein
VTLIQRHFSTSIQLSNPTTIQRLFNVDGQLKFNVDVPAGQALVSFKKYMPPPLPYFKVNICPLPLPHFASIFFAYL